MQDDVASTPSGLLNCLQFLAAEASSLGLPHTLLAIHDAIETCREETGACPPEWVAGCLKQARN